MTKSVSVKGTKADVSVTKNLVAMAEDVKVPKSIPVPIAKWLVRNGQEELLAEMVKADRKSAPRRVPLVEVQPPK
ncbi:MAG: hypothetical protein AAB467_03955 [Patescibacteria group bacterium]